MRISHRVRSGASLVLGAFGTQIGPPDRFDRQAGRAEPIELHPHRKMRISHRVRSGASRGLSTKKMVFKLDGFWAGFTRKSSRIASGSVVPSSGLRLRRLACARRVRHSNRSTGPIWPAKPVVRSVFLPRDLRGVRSGASPVLGAFAAQNGPPDRFVRRGEPISN